MPHTRRGHPQPADGQSLRYLGIHLPPGGTLPATLHPTESAGTGTSPLIHLPRQTFRAFRAVRRRWDIRVCPRVLDSQRRDAWWPPRAVGPKPAGTQTTWVDPAGFRSSTVATISGLDPQARYTGAGALMDLASCLLWYDLFLESYSAEDYFLAARSGWPIGLGDISHLTNATCAVFSLEASAADTLSVPDQIAGGLRGEPPGG